MSLDFRSMADLVCSRIPEDSRALEPDDNAQNNVDRITCGGVLCAPIPSRIWSGLFVGVTMNKTKAQTVSGVQRTVRGGIVYGAAQMAAYVYDRAKEKKNKDSTWLVWMDMDRHLLERAPQCIHDQPATAAGLYARIRNAVNKRWNLEYDGGGCFAVVHFRPEADARADAADKTIANWLANGHSVNNYLPDFMLEKEADLFMNRFDAWFFFVDYIVLRPDGGFISMRESGLVEMDGGEHP